MIFGKARWMLLVFVVAILISLCCLIFPGLFPVVYGIRSDASEALQALADQGRGDYVTDMYLEYINGMSDEEKGNVFRFVRK